MKPNESLSQDEIDALLSAVHSGSVAVTPGSSEGASAQAVRYNFRRPSRVSKEQIRTLQLMHEDFAKLAGASLSGLLRTMVDLELEAVEQIAYSEYVMAVATPTCAFLFNMEPLKGGAVLELHPTLAFAMIERLLGGLGAGVQSPRDLTEIERAVIERVGLRAMIDLQQAWQQIGAFVFRVLNLETNPQFIQATSPSEVILVATFRLKIGEVTGGLTIGYPYLLLESIINRLGGQRWTPTSSAGPTPEARAFLLRELKASALDMRALLGRSKLTVREVLNLREGQLIPLGSRGDRPVRLEINDIPKYAGRLGTHRSRLAVEILGQITEEGTDL
jgi:flagellar motor switch protein FliM